MLPQKLAFVDIETTGGRSFYDRIIEIGIIRVEDNEIVQTYHSLINPQTHLPPEIEMLTGITAQDLENAPTFRQIKTEILETLIDCVFVAHNVRFDYGFLKNEFKREEISFSSKHFCTVRLSRLLYPRFRRHNLDALIERFDIPCENRHRALDDAKVIYHFYQHATKQFAESKLVDAIAKDMKKPNLPPGLKEADLENLPEQPGVYLFYGADGMPLYIGKSKNIRNRVLDHFAQDIHSATEMKISQQIASIETTTTSGELGALFLESQLIKKYLPLYNKMSRVKQELIAVKERINKDGFKEAYLEPVQTIDPENLDSYLGFFRSRRQAKTFLSDMAKEYVLCENLLALESASWRNKSACFAYRLDRCKGACVGTEKPIFYNLRFLQAFSGVKIASWPHNSAILIEESEFSGRREYFLVDKWCFIGSLALDSEGNKKSHAIADFVFDLDMYRILRRYLKSPPKTAKIRELAYEEVKLFLSES